MKEKNFVISCHQTKDFNDRRDIITHQQPLSPQAKHHQLLQIFSSVVIINFRYFTQVKLLVVFTLDSKKTTISIH